MPHKIKAPTIDERLAQPRSHVRRLTGILKSLKDMERSGSMCERELAEIAHRVRVVREIYKTKIKLETLKQQTKEAS